MFHWEIIQCAVNGQRLNDVFTNSFGKQFRLFKHFAYYNIFQEYVSDVKSSNKNTTNCGSNESAFDYKDQEMEIYQEGIASVYFYSY